MGTLTLITGGARAGKTRFAETMARSHAGPVVYLATAEPGDDEMRARIARHRAQRPLSWRTVEAPLDPVAALTGTDSKSLVLFDCLTLWVSNLLLQNGAADERDVVPTDAEARLLDAVRGLLDWQHAARTSMLVVTNEVGLGIVPATPLARLYRDALGRANQMVAARAERVYLVVAGLALELRSAGAVYVDGVEGPG